MESDGKISPQDNNNDSKGTFRKLSNDAANRKYRRRSPLAPSSSSDGSPARKRSSSPTRSRKDDWRHKDEDLDRDYGRNRQGRSGESRRQSDRQSSRGSRSHHKHEDYSRHDRRTEDEDRGYSKPSHSHHDSRTKNYSDHLRRDNDHRPRDNPREVAKHYRDRYEDIGHKSKDRERETSSFKDKDSSFDRVGSGRLYNKSSIDDNRSSERGRSKEFRGSRDEKGKGDYKSDRSPAYEESRSNRNESNSRKDSSAQRLKEASQFDVVESDGEKYAQEHRKKYEDCDRYKDRSYYRESEGKFEDRSVASGKGRESPAKKSKFSGMDHYSEQGKDGSNPASLADGKQSSSSKQGQDSNSELAMEQGLKDSDIDAAKIAAMKAAELVNRNLIGTGIMTADQKKKLLWGNKKATTNTDESTHRWDTSLIGDRERQEKFNKLMSLRLPWCLWPIVGCQRRCKDREQTRYPRCREAEGAPDGLGEAIHCWTSPERWAYSRTRSLRFCLSHRCTCTTLAVFVLCYFALWKLHVCLLTNLCILKFPVPCDYGLYWFIICAVDVKSICFRCFSPLTHLCIVYCTLLLPGIFCTLLVVLLEFRASKGSFCAYNTSMSSVFCLRSYCPSLSN